MKNFRGGEHVWLLDEDEVGGVDEDFSKFEAVEVFFFYWEGDFVEKLEISLDFIIDHEYVQYVQEFRINSKNDSDINLVSVLTKYQ